MTLEQFKAALASIPANIPVSKYVSEKTTLPRVVWNETYYNSETGSNNPFEVNVTAVIEVNTDPDDLSALYEVMRALAVHRIPFQGSAGWDEDNRYTSTDHTVNLTMSLEEVLQNVGRVRGYQCPAKIP